MAGIDTQSTQEFPPLKEVRDGIVVLKDESLRAILMTSSTNFALKSGDEQNSIIYQFQNFLNSLDFSVQIFVQSRKHDIRPYITLLEERYKEQINDLLKIQTHEYIDFIKTFTESANIMVKRFYIIVPYSPSIISGAGKSGPLSMITGKQTKQEEKVSFEEYRTQLEQRVAVIEQGLVRCGIRVTQLGTEEIIELFYKMFNPGEMDNPTGLSKLK